MASAESGTPVPGASPSPPASATDTTLRYITRSFLNLLRLSESPKAHLYEDSLASHKATQAFLNEADTMILRATLISDPSSSQNSLKLSNQVLALTLAPKATALDVFAVKRTRATSSTGLEQFIVFFSSLHDPLSSIYATIHNVFAPQLTLDGGASNTAVTAASSPTEPPSPAKPVRETDPMLRQALTEVDESLLRSIRLAATGSSISTSTSALSNASSGETGTSAQASGSLDPPTLAQTLAMSACSSLSEEVEKWQAVLSNPSLKSSSSSSSASRGASARLLRAAAAIVEALGRVAPRFAELSAAASAINATALAAAPAVARRGSVTQLKPQVPKQAPAAALANLSGVLAEAELLNLLEEAHDACVDVWTVEYPGPASAKLMHMRSIQAMVTRDLCITLKAQVRAVGNIWSTPFATAREVLTSSIAACASWRQACKDFAAKYATELSHPTSSSSSSSSSASGAMAIQQAQAAAVYSDADLAALQRRLSSIMTIRALVNQISLVLSPALNAALQSAANAAAASSSSSFSSSASSSSSSLVSSSSSSSSSSSFSSAVSGLPSLAYADLIALKQCLDAIFSPFSNMDPLHHSPFADEIYQRARLDFERMVAQLERAVSGVLAEHIRRLRSRPELLVAECSLYATLLARPSIRARLGSDSSGISAGLMAHLEHLRTQVALLSSAATHLTTSPSPDAEYRNSSQAITALARTGQLLVKAKQLVAAAAIFDRSNADSSRTDGKSASSSSSLSSSSSSSSSSASPSGESYSSGTQYSGTSTRVRLECEDLLVSLLKLQNSTFAAWHEGVLMLLRDPKSTLKNDLGSSGITALMALDEKQGGQLHVFFSERLVALLREVRQLSELGFYERIDPKIRSLCDEAQNRYRYALRVKQAANFYNSFHREVMPSQLGLLLVEAQQLEDCVRANSKVRWDRPVETDEYLDQLTRAIRVLETRNATLRSLHVQLEQYVLKLASLSVFQHRAAWDECLTSIKQVFEKEERQSLYDPQALAVWRNHWDHQLFKAFNLQYRACLEALVDNLPEMSCDLVFARRAITLRPSVPELREKVFQCIRDLLDAPLSFPGLGKGDLYKLIPRLHADSTIVAYRTAQTMFEGLEDLMSRQESWCNILHMHPELLTELVESTLKTPADWTTNFASLQRLQRQSARLDDVVRIGCFKVSLTPFKSSVEDSLDRLRATLLIALKKSILADAKSLDDFLTSSIKAVTRVPRSMEEVGQAKQDWKDMVEKKPEMEKLLQLVSEKDSLLKQRMSHSSAAVDLSQLHARWEEMGAAIADFTDMIEGEQVHFKNALTKQIEDLIIEFEKFVSRWQALRPDLSRTTNAHDAKEVLESLRAWDQQYKALSEQAEKLVQASSQFDLPSPQPRWAAAEAVGRELREMRAASSLFEEYFAEVSAMAEEKWVDFRPRINTFEDTMKNWQRKVKGRQHDAVQEALLNELKRNLSIFPLLKQVTGEAFEREHWKTLFAKLGFSHDTKIETLQLRDFMRVADVLRAKSREIADLAARAQGEVLIREAVDEIKAWMAQTEFTTLPYTSADGRSTVLIKDWKALFTALSDQVALLSSLKESPFFTPFEDLAAQFEARFALLTDALNNLNHIQRRWTYLEPIFSRGALPHEQGRFSRVDTDFRDIMGTIAADPNVVALTQYPNLRDTTDSLLEQLERCQKALHTYLASKRDKFPRFFFVGDDDLLEILGQSDNPSVIDLHVKKLFAGIHQVVFDSKKNIIGFQSNIKELVLLRTPVPISAVVEDWLQKLLVAMQSTLHYFLVECVALSPPIVGAGKGAAGEASWLSPAVLARYPSQILCLAEEVRFTRRVEAALMAGGGPALQSLLQEQSTQLEDLVSMDVSTDGVLDSKVKALVLGLIHHSDVVKNLLHNKVAEVTHWMWQKEIRVVVLRKDNAGPADFAPITAALNQAGVTAASLTSSASNSSSSSMASSLARMNIDLDSYRVNVVMSSASFAYSFEYQGNEPRLVHTPLTDKCYLVLTQSMHLGYGGNPLGPAGTGKTESVKALGQLLGRQVLVFNCDEGIDFQAMGRIFAGLVKSGAWGCFDEFNRLKEDQLSAVSQQIQVIQAALKRGDKEVELLGRPIEVNRNAAIFVTLNPASREYGGRSKLPHNLKQLFRAVAMSVPDNAQIAEVLLYAEGFSTAGVLAHKLVEVFSLAKQLLSQQVHYDWGLRALKAVLRQGGQVISARRRRKEKLTPEDEAVLLVSVLRMNTLSKLAYADSVRFLQLLKDMFPGVQASDPDYSELRSALSQALRELGLVETPAQVSKMVQLYAALYQRIGVVLVGPSGCGKSTLLTVLDRAMQIMGLRVTRHVMNPKALDRERLLGHMDLDTREWFDGVLTSAAQKVVTSSNTTALPASSSTSTSTSSSSTSSRAGEEEGKHRSWIICDGDVDPEWVESLNSVLDDNRLLTMPNGARIRFDSSVNFVFETHDLSFASPATVSRMGVIYLSEEDVNIAAIVDVWLAEQDPAHAPVLRSLCENYFFRALDWVQSTVRAKPDAMAVTQSPVGIVKSALSQMTSIFPPSSASSTRVTDSQARSLGIFTMSRGFGSVLRPEPRAALLRTMCEWAGERLPSGVHPLDCYVVPFVTQSFLQSSSAASSSFHSSPSAPSSLVAGTWAVYQSRAGAESSLINVSGSEQDGGQGGSESSASSASAPLVHTVAVLRDIDTLRAWLVPNTASASASKAAAAANAAATASSNTAAGSNSTSTSTSPSTSTSTSAAAQPRKSGAAASASSSTALHAPHAIGSGLSKLQPVLVVGPEGCGKSLLVQTILSGLRHTTVATIHCSAQTKASHVIQKLMDACSIFSTHKGRVLKPKDGGRVVLFLKDLNLPKPDMYRTTQLVAFLEQLISHEGFHDDALDWVGVEGLQIIACMSPSSTLGRHPLSSRFTSVVRTVYIDSPTPEHLQQVYTGYFASLLTSSTFLLPSSALSQSAAAATNSLVTGPVPDWQSSGIAGKLAASCVDVLTRVRGLFSPDDHRHYLFTPRDLTRWTLGIRKHVCTPESLLAVWAYEADRIFGDRLVDDNARVKFRAVLAAVLQSRWSVAVDVAKLIRTSLVDPFAAVATSVQEDPDRTWEVGTLLEAVSLNEFAETVGHALYAYERDVRALRLLLFPDLLARVAHIARVLATPAGSLLLVGDSGVGRRALVALSAHMLSMHLFAPHLTASYSTKNFRTDLKELVRVAVSIPVNSAGGSSSIKGVVLLLEDHSIVNELILQDVNSLLSGGEVPGLFSPAELETVLQLVRDEFKSERRGAKTVYEYFCNKVLRNLHVAICLTPSHPQFRQRTETNPALLSRCTTVWLGRWSNEGMQAVADRRLSTVVQHMEHELSLRLAAGAKPVGKDASQILQIAQYVHSTRVPHGAGPAKYVAFLETFDRLFRAKRASLTVKRSHLQAGLTKLTEAATTVDTLSGQAQKQHAQVAAKQAQADAALESITKHMTVVADRQREAASLKSHLEQEEKKLEGRKLQIEAELKDILPILQAAERAVGTIQRDNINEIRAYKMPPAQISHVLGAVLTLKGVQDLTWNNMRKFLGDPGVKESIIKFDVRTVTRETRLKVQNLISKSPDSFEPRKIAAVSFAAAPLAEWVLAQLEYAKVLETVQPKQREFDDANGLLESARQRQMECANDLVRLEQEVKQLKATFAQTTSEAEALKIGLEKINTTLASAQGLLGKLSSEQERWAVQVRQLSASLMALPFNTLLVAGFIAYLGSEEELAREAALEDWRTKCGLKKANFLSFMATESQALLWKREGLDSDTLSLQNAAIILASASEAAASAGEAGMKTGNSNQNKKQSGSDTAGRASGDGSANGGRDGEQSVGNGASSPLTPFVVDPTRRVLTWLQTHLNAVTTSAASSASSSSTSTSGSSVLSVGGAGAGTRGGYGGASSGTGSSSHGKVEVIALQHERLVSTLELAVRFGRTIIIHEVDTVPPVLYPLLRKELCRQGPRSVVQIGDKAVDYNPSFTMFLFTRNASAKVSVDIASELSLVNFSTTRAGLEEQLLGVTVNFEYPTLEKQKSDLLAQEEQCKVSLASLEEALLEELARSEGNILENLALLQRLDATKSQAVTIAESLAQSQLVQSQLEGQREAYRPVAQTGASLYFLITQLSAVNSMYQFALPGFMDIFKANHREYLKLRGLNDVIEEGKVPQDRPPQSPDEAAKVGMAVSTSLVQRVYAYVAQGLLKADRPTFAAHAVHALKPNVVPSHEWDVLLGRSNVAAAAVAGNSSASSTSSTSSSSVPVPAWVPHDRVDACQSLLAAIPQLSRALSLQDEALWRPWLMSASCDRDFPAQAASITPFQRVLLVSALRPDKLQDALVAFACEHLQLRSLAPPPMQLGALVSSVRPREPILFISTAGADPSFEIEEFANKHFASSSTSSTSTPTQSRSRFSQLAMGSGQSETALALIHSAARSGDWVLLKNLHLVVGWLHDLEKAINALDPHPDFRLFLTTEEHHAFPPLLLQQSLKVTYEAPPGVKQNLLRTYEGWDDAYIAKGSVARAQMLFVLALFHATVQERRSYIPQGWCKFYEFAQPDLRSGADIIDSLFEAHPGSGKPVDIAPADLGWNALWGLMRVAIYGGRVDNEHDLRVLTTYIRKYFAADVLANGTTPARRRVLPNQTDIPMSRSKADYLRVVNSLPDTDLPGLFDLPSNANLAVSTTQTALLIGALRKIDRSQALITRFDRTLWREALEPIIFSWRSLAPSNSNSSSSSSSGTSSRQRPSLKTPPEQWTPVEAFFHLENMVASIMAEKTDATLNGLAAVVGGTGVLTQYLQTAGSALVVGDVPASLHHPEGAPSTSWYPTSPAVFLRVLARRLSMLAGLISATNEAGIDKVLSRPVSLASMFRPRTFFNALRQQTARKSGLPIDSLRLAVAWDPNHLPANAMYRVPIEGLLLQGASFVPARSQNEAPSLGDLQANSPIFEQMPPCYVAYVGASDPEPYGPAPARCPSAGVMPVPVYLDATREELVIEFKVPIAGKLPKWILSGVAICISSET